MVTINPNSLGLDSVTLLQQYNATARNTSDTLRAVNSSAGECDYLADNTPDVLGMLGMNRLLAENNVHILNDELTNSRSQYQIQFIDLCVNIAQQLGPRLSSIRTNVGIPDQTFSSWCSEQLANIGNTANRPMFDGTYPCGGATAFLPPVNVNTIQSSLPSGAGPTLDYAVGSFSTYTARLSQSRTVLDQMNVTNAGVENIIRTLRMCLSGDVTNSLDPTWAVCNDLLVTGAIPNLGEAMKNAGNLGGTAQDVRDELKDELSLIAKQYQTYAFVPEMELIQTQMQAQAISRIQESNIFSNLKMTQQILDKFDQLF